MDTYFTAVADSTEELDNIVNAHIEAGWKPFGSAYALMALPSAPKFYQPMTREPRSEKGRGAFGAIMAHGRSEKGGRA